MSILLGHDPGDLMNRWPFRQGTAAGMGAMVLIAIGTVAFLNASAAGALPVGYPAQGMYVYENACASCHGFYGDGTLEGPALTGAGSPVEMLSRNDLAGRIEHPDGEMPLIEITRQDVADTIAYLKDVQAFGG